MVRMIAKMVVAGKGGKSLQEAFTHRYCTLVGRTHTHKNTGKGFRVKVAERTA